MKYQLNILLFFLMSYCSAQDGDDYFKPDFMRFENHVYVPYIQTVLLEKDGQALSDPVIILNSGEALRLQFDLLEDEIRDFSYRLVHCTSEWRPSPISESDFIDGFYSDHITDYKHSLNTRQDYWHYQLLFPNQQLKPLLSGNYLLVVYNHSDPDSIVLTRRFYVAEPRVELQANIHRATLIELRNSHQEADFSVFLKGLRLNNPYAELKTLILQNGNYNNKAHGLKPLFATSEQLDFNLEEGNVFEGGSEYRPLDLRTTRFLTQTIERFSEDSIGQGLTAVLKPDRKLATQRYSSADDINGKFLVKVYEGRDGHLEGDYLNVHFRLLSALPESASSVYLEGGFSPDHPNQRFRMNYNPACACYELTILLKQGYYNYRYVQLDATGTYSVLETEGSHYETRNEYDFFVYWQEPGSRHEKLIGYKKVQAGGF
ncbi:MAG: DUF5103 domain-containing protein [Bacteroidia bacterium]|nr:DUF5103 domain-containing protein [Bacteroidia bacterium]